MTPINSSK